MKKIGTIKIHCISEALSILTHMKGHAGNEAILNREYIDYNGIIKSVPILSGNSIRHRMIRQPGSLYLVKQLDLYGNLTIDQANFLFNGGSLMESSTSDNLRTISQMQELFPLLRLLGGSLRNQIISGSLFCLRGILICEENRDILKRSLPKDFSLPEDELRSSEDFISDYQYTRSDILKNGGLKDLVKESEIEEESKLKLMIYNGQTIIPGSMFHHGFILNNVSHLEIGALLHSIIEWKNYGATIGGYSRVGHGILDTNFIFEDTSDFFETEINFEDTISMYIQHVEDNKEKCITWLNENFPDSKKKKEGKTND